MGKQNLTIQGNDQAVQAALAEVRTSDKTAENSKMIGCSLIVVFTILGFLVLQSGVLPLILFASVGWIVGIILYRRGNSGDIENARYEQVGRLHKFLALDCDQDAQFSYEMNLRAYDDSAYYLREEKFGEGASALPRGTRAFYQMPLLTSRVRLRDGTMLTIAVERATAKKTTTKRGVSGKIKTKSKLKYRDIYRVRVKVPEGAAHPPLRLPKVSKNQPETDYKAAGPKATAVYVRKGMYDRVPDLDVLLKLLCLVFFSLHQERRRPA